MVSKAICIVAGQQEFLTRALLTSTWKNDRAFQSSVPLHNFTVCWHVRVLLICTTETLSTWKMLDSRKSVVTDQLWNYEKLYSYFLWTPNFVNRFRPKTQPAAKCTPGHVDSCYTSLTVEFVGDDVCRLWAVPACSRCNHIPDCHLAHSRKKASVSAGYPEGSFWASPADCRRHKSSCNKWMAGSNSSKTMRE